MQEERKQSVHPLAWLLVSALVVLSLFQVSVSGIDYYFETMHGHFNRSRKLSVPTLQKIRIDGSRQFLWAKGDRHPDPDQAEWFEMTGTPIDLQEVNHGIGRDTITSIDDPVFVKPGDARLRKRWRGRYDANIDDLAVIGYVHNGDARAYPIRLLNRHELVNDVVGGKPVTIGW